MSLLGFRCSWPLGSRANPRVRGFTYSLGLAVGTFLLTGFTTIRAIVRAVGCWHLFTDRVHNDPCTFGNAYAVGTYVYTGKVANQLFVRSSKVGTFLADRVHHHSCVQEMLTLLAPIPTLASRSRHAQLCARLR